MAGAAVVKLELENGVHIEILGEAGSDGEFYSDGDGIVRKLNEALEPVVVFASEALDQLRDGVSPTTLELQFGAEAGGEGGFFGLAKAHAKATIQIKLTYEINGSDQTQ